jgi:microcystin-dependent protein
MTFWKWSRTAASNAGADSSINWAEGQAPSSVNDSARAMMAAAAKYRDDIAGAILTSGTATAYAVATFQGFDTLGHLDGAMVAFTPHATCAATVTLNVDGLGARPLRSAPGTELPAGMLIQGTPYAATYSAADGAFYLHGLFGNPYGVPVGGLMPYVGASAPNSAFVFPFGQAISRTVYAGFFAMVGTSFGGGDGATTFNVPDLRGRVAAGKDDMGGTAAARIGSVVTDGGTVVGATLGSTGGSATHVMTVGELAQHTHATSVIDPGHSHTLNAHITGLGNSGAGNTVNSGAGLSTDVATTGISVTNANTGSSSAMAWLQPTIILNYLLRVI